MRRLALLAIFFVVAALGGLGTAQAKPMEGGPSNHGQCVSNSAQPSGKGGRSEVAKQSSECAKPPAQLDCVENENTPGTVDLDSDENTVTVTGSGPGSLGSSLACETAIPVVAGESTVTFTYTLGEGTDPCGGGVPRMYVLINGTYYNTIDGDPQCEDAAGNTVTYTIPVTGTVTEVGFVYDRGDNGSITYSDATVGNVTLNI